MSPVFRSFFSCCYSSVVAVSYTHLDVYKRQVNTYKLTKESIQFRSNEVFRDATMREVFYRMEVYQDSLQKKYKDNWRAIILIKYNITSDFITSLIKYNITSLEGLLNTLYAFVFES